MFSKILCLNSKIKIKIKKAIIYSNVLFSARKITIPYINLSTNIFERMQYFSLNINSKWIDLIINIL